MLGTTEQDIPAHRAFHASLKPSITIQQHDESAITGESAPVIRESGGDRSAVTGGTRVLSDRIVVRITADPGESFLDRMISLVEGADRQKTPNEIALSILSEIVLVRKGGTGAKLSTMKGVRSRRSGGSVEPV